MKIAAEKLISFKKAKENMLMQAKKIEQSISIPTINSLGRITAESIISPINLPSFNSAAMDGYAIRFNDAKINNSLKIHGQSLAGKPFDKNWPNGSALRIMTGAIIPKGCDVVIKQEDIKIFDNNIIIEKPIVLGQNIRWTGENIKNGDIVINSGVKISISELPLIASLGIVEINVIRKLRVAIFSTGDELKSISEKIQFGQIYDINRLAISLMLNKLGCEVVDLGIVKDNIKDIRNAVKEADNCSDIVITTGSVSVGKTDFIRNILKELGKIIFYKVAIKPGKPFVFGSLNESWFIGLPGNPVSAIVTFYHLATPFILKCMGQNYPSFLQQRYKVRVATYLKKTPGIVEFQRGFLFYNKQNEIMEVYTTGIQDSHIYASFTKANCFIILEAERGNVEVGEWVEIELFNELLEG
ncbi:molybdopterin molybdotransferase [Candidatus Pantoea edessiphila]|uniref:Molybdopterin molybdenumtransferase n=1 Tax=Candidatus Pantoea edessiphila TaxID=2044610 RepID=A0A2P5T0I5_9GAMM|nr:molybdopterin molybdotransferase MoeA [Candidatus Pantoea edessiphila]PPI88076.1 molybdopterin molybdotransferase [Candidatus Pantoea edessiphila]